MDNNVRADGINIWNIFCRDPLAMTALVRAIDFLDATIKRSWNRVPKMEKGVLFKADIDEHRLQPHFDVLDPALVDRADDIASAVALDVIFFQPSVFE